MKKLLLILLCLPLITLAQNNIDANGNPASALSFPSSNLPNFPYNNSSTGSLPFVVKDSIPIYTGIVGLAYDGEFLWAAGFNWYHIFKISTVTGNIIDSIPISFSEAYGLTYDGNDLWIVERTSWPYQHKVHRIDTSSGNILQSFSIPSDYPNGLAWDGNLWHNDNSDWSYSNYTHSISASTGGTLQTYSTYGQPAGLAWDGQYLWCSHNGGIGIIQKYDISTFTIVDSIITPWMFPNDLAWDGSHLWVADNGLNMIFKIFIENNGCTDSTALNYDPVATADDGSCVYVPGCINPTACNYNALADVDDGSCILPDGCADATACNYDATATCDDGSCEWNSCNTCNNDPISGLGVTGIIHNRATFTFDEMNTYNAMGVQVCRVDQLRIQYREAGSSSWSQKNIASPTGYDPVTGICNSTSNTSKLTLGLTAATTYEWRMKVWYCGIGNSGWVSGPNFTTLDDCPNVGNLAVSTPTTTKATFTWGDSNGPYSFVRIISRVDTNNATWFNVGGAGVAYGIFTKNKNNLSPGTSYRAQARTWCDPNGGAYKSPAWTSLIYWTMPTIIRLEGGTTIANLEVYPNPSRDVFNLTFTSETIQDLKVRILNVVGEELVNEDLQQFVGEYTKQIDLSNNAKGIYFLEIETNNGVINKKLILQ